MNLASLDNDCGTTLSGNMILVSANVVENAILNTEALCILELFNLVVVGARIVVSAVVNIVWCTLDLASC